MTESWEEHASGAPAPAAPRPALNPNASTFSFNPNASTFNFVPGGGAPSFAPPPPPPVQQPAPPPQPPAPAQPEPVPQDEPMTDGAGAAAASDLADDVQSRLEVQEPAAVAPPAAAPSPPPPAAAATPPPPVVDEPVAPVDESAILKAYEQLVAEDGRDHLNIVFIGHIDAGKSTLAGQILFVTGGVDKRTIEKYEKEAKEKNREGWYMAYIMDTNEEERAKGITVEVGRAHFETDKKRYTILDAPGHKNYVPNMIQGACQADVAILLVSARKGEFETGFERGGQTREHAQLAKTLGVSRLIVVVNKLDDSSVCLPGGKWDQGRFDGIVNGITPFLRSCGYNLKKEVQFLPVAALYGHNVKERIPPGTCDWYTGPTLFEALDAIDSVDRNPLAPVRLPIVDKWRDMGTILMGKIESGFLRVGDVMHIMPNRLRVKIEGIFRDEKEVSATRSGENLRLRVTGAEETDIMPGFVLSSIKNPVPCVTQFEAQLMIVELLEHNSIFTVGYKSVLHIHTAVEECEITKLVAEIDMKTKEQKKAKFIKTGGLCICRISVDKPICIESFSDVAALGRFTLRDEGRTIAIGKVTKLPKVH